MAKKIHGGKTKMEFFGTAELLQKIEKASGNVEKAIIKSLELSIELPKKDMLDFMSRHKLTGDTYNSFTIEPIEEKDGIIKCKFGFSISKGGLPALFLNLGVPNKIEPSFFIDRAVADNMDEIKNIQLKALEEIFKELM